MLGLKALIKNHYPELEPNGSRSLFEAVCDIADKVGYIRPNSYDLIEPYPGNLVDFIIDKYKKGLD